MKKPWVFIYALFLGLFLHVSSVSLALEVNESDNPVIFVLHDSAQPIVKVTILARDQGLLNFPLEQEGRSNLVIFMIGELLKEQVTELWYNDLINELSYHTNSQGLWISFLTKKENVAHALSRLHKLLLPGFNDQRRFRVLKDSWLSAYFQAEQADPLQFLSGKWFRQAFPKDERGVMYGTTDSIEGFNLEDFDSLWSQLLTANNLIYAFSGDITLAQAKNLVHDFQKTLPHIPAQPVPNPQSPPLLQGKTKVYKMERPQCDIFFAHQGLKKNHPDYYTFLVLQAILGGNSYTSRLYTKLRDELGIVYALSFSPASDTMSLMGFFSTANETADLALQAVREVFQTFKEKGVNKTEFMQAKNQVIGSHVSQLTNLGGINNTLINNYLDDIPNQNFINDFIQKVDKVTLEELNQFAHKFLEPSSIDFLIMGKPVLFAPKQSERLLDQSGKSGAVGED